MNGNFYYLKFSLFVCLVQAFKKNEDGNYV